MPILFQKYPHLNAQIPWIPLGKFPTPVHRLANLEDTLGFESLWIKRDERGGPLGGGNKVRKLEFLLADAKDKNCKTLFALGPKGSNYVRATAVYGKAAGFDVQCLLYEQPHTGYYDSNFHTIYAHADRIREVTYKAPMVCLYGYEYLKQLCVLHKSRYFLPPGGSSPLGCLGYVNAAFELKAQLDAGILPEPKLIFVALGTCGTMAGLVAGARLAGLRSQIVGVRVVDRIVANPRAVARLARGTLKLIGETGRIGARDIDIWHRDFGRGYAIPTVAGSRAVQMMQEQEGIRLETTYTGKALAGLIHYVKAHQCEREPILFWNTYGGG
jgi:1-aminocyclopropane-1-carboxylate deaminase/D-cysteine desulfhydrase-like pyridoxal-dependent ACC family enzyme